ncbi:MAG: hypothetical protein IJT24_02205 [Lachnospiraceae bacterium]|nr:hypothetical protein [Lachnospiraceae bacterium]
MLYEPIGAYSKTSYSIPELSATVHSFEELCYIVREKIYDVGDFIMKDEMLYYIRDELAIAELYDRLYRARPDLERFIKTLLSYRHHMPEDEIEAACVSLKDGSDAKEYVRLISRGDFFTANERYRPAILMYEHARELMDEESEKEGLTYRELMVKLGKLYSLFFMFEKAAECFAAAGDARRSFFCRKLSLSRVEYTDMLLRERPDEGFAAEIDEMMREPAETAGLKSSLKENRSYGRDLALRRLSERLKAEYRRISQ